MEGLICPKCHGVMRTYERSGVTVDQCTECRGVFLDRGELERLVDAENSHYDARDEPRREEPRREEPRYEQPRRVDYGEQYRGGYGHHRHGYGHKKHKRRSFLEELFD